MAYSIVSLLHLVHTLWATNNHYMKINKPCTAREYGSFHGAYEQRVLVAGQNQVGTAPWPAPHHPACDVLCPMGHDSSWQQQQGCDIRNPYIGGEYVGAESEAWHTHTVIAIFDVVTRFHSRHTGSPHLAPRHVPGPLQITFVWWLQSVTRM